MTTLAFALSAVLLLITALHVYWGLGGIWPGRDGASCAHAVVGFRGVDEMPTTFACFAVAACLCLATLWPLALIGFFASPFPGKASPQARCSSGWCFSAAALPVSRPGGGDWRRSNLLHGSIPASIRRSAC
ncbi:DUF3995 domain-containing protein [Mesorhizobium caraganae]